MAGKTETDDGPLGLVFNIQKFSLHDGPGIRTLCFLKGCPLACIWCSNPEGQSCSTELVYSRDRCIGTDACDCCITACERRAILRTEDGKVKIDRDACDVCGCCAAVCPPKAIEVSGQWLGVDDVIRIVEEDDAFYTRSGGGLTISGGEPLAQGTFVRALLSAARSRGIDTAIETSGLCSWQTLRDVAPLVDRIFYDIKCVDAEKHVRATGTSNRNILENFRRLRSQFPEVAVVVRTPVIPGTNDSADDIRAIAEFIGAAGGATAYELLPYHELGEPKYRKLGQPYPMGHRTPLDDTLLHELQEIAAGVE